MTREEYRNKYRATNKREYNCGGYALGTFTWYRPYPQELSDKFFHVDTIIDQVFNGDMSAFVCYCVDYMLADFAGRLRMIQSEEEKQENEYVIAFRVAPNDFHYMKKGHNNVWYEKMGSSYYINSVKATDVFAEAWHECRYDGGYNSEIVLLAMRED